MIVKASLNVYTTTLDGYRYNTRIFCMFGMCSTDTGLQTLVRHLVGDFGSILADISLERILSSIWI